MKRLVDETTDELTRSLLSAGIEHRPPPGNKAKVIVALGAGGAIGLFSSNAFAWLSTTAGKVTVGVTAIGVAVGVAGTVWVAAPGGEARHGAGDEGSATAEQLVASGQRSASSGAARAGDAPAPGEDPSLPELSGDPSAPASAASPASAEAEARQGRASGSRRERSARRARRAASRERARAAQSELSERAPSEASPAVDELEPSSSEQADLDAEVKLVDDMHWAARRNDHEALGRFVERYQAAFPDGQLKKEVDSFAARLERDDMAP